MSMPVRPPPILSRPSSEPSIVTVSEPAQASTPTRTRKSTATVAARAASSVPRIVAPAARNDRTNIQPRTSAPTRLTLSGAISMAVRACAPSRPNALRSPEGVTDPPTASTTAAAIIGPSRPVPSAPSSFKPSAATAAIARKAQLTAAMEVRKMSTPRVVRLPLPVVITAPRSHQLPGYTRSVRIRGRLLLSGGVPVASTGPCYRALINPDFQMRDCP